jgi:hypothetical protein
VCPYRAWPESPTQHPHLDTKAPKHRHRHAYPLQGAAPDSRPHLHVAPNVLVLLSQPPELSKNLAYFQQVGARDEPGAESSKLTDPRARNNPVTGDEAPPCGVRARDRIARSETRVWWGSSGRHPSVLSALASVLACSRKEVIQPQVPLRLPCYDFAPVTELAFGRSLPCGLGDGLRALPASMA